MCFPRSLCILWMLILSAVTIHSEVYYDSQPKILTNEGTLIVEAVRDRNITLRLSQNSVLLVNDVNVLEVIKQKSKNTTAVEQEQLPTLLPTVAFVQAEIMSLARELDRMAKSLLEHQAQPSTRIFAGRLLRLLTRVTHIENTLMVDACLGSGPQATSPCQNGGTCFNGYKDFHCECAEGWTGKTCEEDVDECYLYAGTDLGCQNNANCTNTPGSYNCVCRKGTSGTHCRLRNAICDTAQSAELCGHGVCVHANNDIGYTCICDQGWTKDNGSTHACTIDVNECDEATNPCHSECINSPGSFKCGACPRGYAGNGVTCIDIDECASFNGGCSVRPKVACINSEGSYHCGNCPLGWLGNGRNCEPSNSCNGENICHILAMCEYISETVVCTCPPGMLGHGFGPSGCTAEVTTNSCAYHKCKNNGTCIESRRGTRCICELGYTGALCDQNDACHPNPCLNGGTCALLSNNKFRCSCLQGSTGSTCDVLRDICGSILHQETGELSYPPDTASSYEPNEYCGWIISTANTKIINVTFTRFDLESDTDCSKDWLQIHDGRSLAAQLIGRFCGNELPLGGNFVSSHQQLFFWFRSDNTTNGAGFEMSWTSKPHICGDVLNLRELDSGVVRSPGYPGKTAINRDCEWQFEAPYGYRLVLRFYEVNLGGDQNCTRDTLKIFDSDILLKSICETDSSSPEPLHTSSNKANLHFHTDAIRTDSSFQLHYEVVPAVPHCGGLFTEASGILSGYMDAKVCLYLIQQPAGTQIKLEFTNLNLISSNTSCVLQKIEIFDGKTDEDPLMNRLCGHDKPEALTSNGNFMLLRYEYLLNGLETHSNSFEAKYSRICDSSFSGPDSGVFTTPNYPNAYFDHMTCTFNIYGPENTVVQLNFTDFSMTQTLPSLLNDDDTVSSNRSALANDFTNYVDVYLSNKNKRRYYKGEPMIILSEKNRAQIVFHSDLNSLKSRGIRVEYTFKNTEACGGVLTENSVTIGYQSSGCEWIIEAPAGKHILLDMTFASYGLKCIPEVGILLIYTNSSDGSGQLVGSYCDDYFSIYREPFYTNIMTIILKERPPGEESSGKYYFYAAYSFANSDEECGGNFSAHSGIIRTPGWPKPYHASMNCTWVISAQLGHKIELVVRNFSLEATTESFCRNDILEIRNGKTKESPLIGKYCGSKIPARIPSFTNNLYLNFVSDDSISDLGFYITWKQTATGCGGKLTSNKGSIHSPQSPEYSHVVCDWQIIVAQGSTIDINLTTIVEPGTLLCRDKILIIYDGPTSDSRALKLTDTNDAMMLKSASNQVLIRYAKGVLCGNVQFILDYDTNCNVLIDNLQGGVESPNFPEEYPVGMNCAWDIHGGRNNKISLEFSHLQLGKRNENCNYNYVELVDMRNDLVLSKEKYCDSPPPVIITSQGNHIILKFLSDFLANGVGFHVQYKRIGCGEHIQEESTSIESPNAPYSVNMDCDWYIEVPAGKQIILNIHELQIETEQRDCTKDAFTVTAEKNSTDYLLRECQVEQMPITITSPANRLYLHFVTSDTRSRKYFKATTNTVEATCGGTYRGNNGVITSPNIANGFGINVECVWSINVEHANGIVLTFTEFNVTDSLLCSRTFVKIKNLDNDDENFLKNSCKEITPHIQVVHGNRISVTLKVHQFGWAKFSMRYEKYLVINFPPAGNALYPPNTHCTWRIRSAEDFRIEFTSLLLQNVSQVTGKCIDYLHVKGNHLSKYFCGNATGYHVYTFRKYGYVEITFHSDATYEDKGFSLTAVHRNNCNRTYTKFSDGVSYETRDETSFSCVDEIRVPDNYTLSLFIPTIYLHDANNCSYSHLKVVDINSNATLLDRCNQTRGEARLFTTTNALRIYAASFSFIKFLYVASSRSLPPGCGGQIYTNHGYFSSPPYSDSNHSVCRWDIKVPSSHTINLDFYVFDMGTNCQTDYVNILEVQPNGNEKRIYNFCGQDVPERFNTPGSGRLEKQKFFLFQKCNDMERRGKNHRV